MLGETNEEIDIHKEKKPTQLILSNEIVITSEKHIISLSLKKPQY